jgi:hypothetical protein
VGDDRLARSASKRGKTGTNLGNHAGADHSLADERLRLFRAEGGDAPAELIEHAFDVGQQHELARARPGRQARGGLVGVHVADLAMLVDGQRGDDGQQSGKQQRVQDPVAHTDHARDATESGHALTHEHFHAGDPDRLRAMRAHRRDELRVDQAAEHRDGDLDGGLVRDAEAVLEPALDAQPVQPLGQLATAAVDHRHRPAARQIRYVTEDLALLGDRGAAKLDHDQPARAAHVAPRPLGGRTVRFMSCRPSSR